MARRCKPVGCFKILAYKHMIFTAVKISWYWYAMQVVCCTKNSA